MPGANVVAYEAEAAPGAVNICHCHDCQTLSVAACRAPSSRRPVSRLFVECALLAMDVGLVDLLRPVLCRNLFEADRDGFLAEVKRLADRLCDFIGKLLLLRFGFPGPEFHNHMRHRWLLP